jgi:hypothetical protein
LFARKYGLAGKRAGPFLIPLVQMTQVIGVKSASPSIGDEMNLFWVFAFARDSMATQKGFDPAAYQCGDSLRPSAFNLVGCDRLSCYRAAAV